MLSEAVQTGTRSAEESMMLTRLLEGRLQELCDQGYAGDLHFSKGQEAVSAGVISMLRPSDYIVVHHRTIAHAIAKGVPLKPLVAEILGKASGINGGVAGEMHMSYPEKRFMFSFQLVGTCIPVAAGLAWAAKYHHKTDDITAVFFGDAATANAQFHEGLNLAAVQNVPLLLVCENNHLAGNVRPKHYMPTKRVSQRAEGYGIDMGWCDGNSLIEVQAMAAQAIEYVRKFSRPFLLECDTTRLGKHKQGQGDLRTKDEVAALAERDPIKKISLSREQIAGLAIEVEEAIQDAMKESV